MIIDRAAKFIDALREKPYTIKELASHCNVQHQTANLWIRDLQNAGLVFIADWKDNGIQNSAAYAWRFSEDQVDVERRYKNPYNKKYRDNQKERNVSQQDSGSRAYSPA